MPFASWYKKFNPSWATPELGAFSTNVIRPTAKSLKFIGENPCENSHEMRK